MTLAAGDLTTPQRVVTWMPNPPPVGAAILAQLITSMTNLIYSKLNRKRLYNQTISRAFDGTGTNQIVLPDWPVTKVNSVQMGAAIINPSPLPNPTTGIIPPPNYGYGYRVPLWDGNMPGDPAVMEFIRGIWWPGSQNILISFNAGYLESNEAGTVPQGTPYIITVLQPQGLWCRDNGVTYASSGIALTPVANSSLLGTGKYVPPPDSFPGLYTFSSGDANANLLFSYSFIPADLEEACIQMVVERYMYRERVGTESKSLGGQETMRWLRGGNRGQMFRDLPPEVEGLIWPYVSTIPPVIGAPV